MQKNSKKLSILTILAIIFLICGGLSGYFVGDYLTKEDTFTLIGEKVVYLEKGGQYVEEGAMVIALRKKVSADKIKIQGSVDSSTEGQYILKYTVNHIRFKGVCRYRTVIVQGDEGEVQP